MKNIYEYDESPLTSHGIEVPVWISQDISAYDVTSINRGGCASGAYMPGVIYHEALATMNDHCDEIFDFMESMDYEIPKIDPRSSWKVLACTYVSTAVELWASQFDGQFSENEVAQ